MNSLSHVTWRKSSRSSQEGACVEVADVSHAVWRKSARSQQGPDCVEVAGLGGAVAVRDSKNPDGPTLVFGHRAFSGLLHDVRSGRFN